MLKRLVTAIVFLVPSVLAATGCIQRQQYNYSYPDFPYYTSDDSCGSASAAECRWAKAEVQKIKEESAAATWGSAVALTLLASIDVEPEN
jgi:hypothetical protein